MMHTIEPAERHNLLVMIYYHTRRGSANAVKERIQTMLVILRDCWVYGNYPYFPLSLRPNARVRRKNSFPITLTPLSCS